MPKSKKIDLEKESVKIFDKYPLFKNIKFIIVIFIIVISLASSIYAFLPREPPKVVVEFDTELLKELNDEELKQNIFTLTREVIQWSEDRINNNPEWNWENIELSEQEYYDYKNETMNYYYDHYWENLTICFWELKKREIEISKEDDDFIKFLLDDPTNLLVIEEIAIRMKNLAEQL